MAVFVYVPGQVLCRVIALRVARVMLLHVNELEHAPKFEDAAAGVSELCIGRRGIGDIVGATTRCTASHFPHRY